MDLVAYPAVTGDLDARSELGDIHDLFASLLADDRHDMDREVGRDIVMTVRDRDRDHVIAGHVPTVGDVRGGRRRACARILVIVRLIAVVVIIEGSVEVPLDDQGIPVGVRNREALGQVDVLVHIDGLVLGDGYLRRRVGCACVGRHASEHGHAQEHCQD